MMKMNGEDRSGWYKSNNQQENQKMVTKTNGKAVYSAIYQCGCEDKKEYASLDHARVWQAKVAMKQCLKCHYIGKQTDGRDSYAHQLLNQLPALKGTPAQIYWAASIRQRYLDALGEHGQPVKGNSVIMKTKKAAQWIAMKDNDFNDEITQLIAPVSPIKYVIVSVSSNTWLLERIMGAYAIIINIPSHATTSPAILEWIIAANKNTFAKGAMIAYDDIQDNLYGACIARKTMIEAGIPFSMVNVSVLISRCGIDISKFDVGNVFKWVDSDATMDALVAEIFSMPLESENNNCATNCAQ